MLTIHSIGASSSWYIVHVNKNDATRVDKLKDVSNSENEDVGVDMNENTSNSDYASLSLWFFVSLVWWFFLCGLNICQVWLDMFTIWSFDCLSYFCLLGPYKENMG